MVYFLFACHVSWTCMGYFLFACHVSLTCMVYFLFASSSFFCFQFDPFYAYDDWSPCLIIDIHLYLAYDGTDLVIDGN